jgi:SAM-dependent methyltransferase
MTMKNLLRPCAICGGGTGEVLHTQRFFLSGEDGLPAAYDVAGCPACGFVFADTPALQADYDRYYLQQSKYEDARISSGGGTLPWDAQRLERTALDISTALPDRGAGILDLGCANGGLLLALRRRGYVHLAGVDLSPRCVQRMRDLNIQAHVGGLFSLPGEAADHRDAVILSHVLEHVRDLARARDVLARLVATGGMLYVEVPDAARYADHFIVPYYYFDCEHINHFGPVSLENLFLGSGFELLTLETKEIVVTPTAAYPALYAVFKKTEGMAARRDFACDHVVRSSVLSHVELSAGSSLSPQIEEWVLSQEDLIIWGAGSHALRLMENTPLGRCRIVAFVDSDSAKQGRRLKTIPIASPDILDRHRGPIVVCSALFHEDIVNEISRRGLPNPVLVLA